MQDLYHQQYQRSGDRSVGFVAEAQHLERQWVSLLPECLVHLL